MVQKQLKILHLLSQRPESTGSGIYIQAMLLEAGNRGHRNFLMAGIPEDIEPALSCVSANRCSFVRFGGSSLPYPVVGMSDVMPYPSTRFCDLSEDDLHRYEESFAEKMQTVAREFQPDIIHSHHLWVLTALARRLFPRLPIVATCHGSDLRQFRNCPHIGAKVSEDCRNLSGILALSQAQKTEIGTLYNTAPDRIHITGAGYNETLFYPERKPEPEPIQLLYAGKLSRSKGVPWLLRALSRIDTPIWQLHLVGGGSGEEQAECSNLAAKLADRVKVHGPLPQESLAAIMRQSHLFVLPSFFEGLPLVLLEALASGCRLVSTALPGVMEVIGSFDRDYIRLVELPRLHDVDSPDPDDEAIYEERLRKAIEEQLQAITADPAIDFSRIASQIAAFKWSSVFERVEKIYLETIGG